MSRNQTYQFWWKWVHKWKHLTLIIFITDNFCFNIHVENVNTRGNGRFQKYKDEEDKIPSFYSLPQLFKKGIYRFLSRIPSCHRDHQCYVNVNEKKSFREHNCDKIQIMNIHIYIFCAQYWLKRCWLRWTGPLLCMKLFSVYSGSLQATQW